MAYIPLVSICVICGFCLLVNGQCTTPGCEGSSLVIDEIFIRNSVTSSVCAQQKGQCTASACTVPTSEKTVAKTARRRHPEKTGMAGQRHMTHIANDTDEDLEVLMEYSGKSFPLIVPTKQYQCVKTNVRKVFLCDPKTQRHDDDCVSMYGPPWSVNGAVDGSASFVYDEPGKVRVTIRGLSGQRMREIQSDRSIVIRKNGSRYAIHLAKYGKLWQIE